MEENIRSLSTMNSALLSTKEKLESETALLFERTSYLEQRLGDLEEVTREWINPNNLGTFYFFHLIQLRCLMFRRKQDFTITGKPLENEEWHAGVPFNFSALTKMTLLHRVIPSALNLTFAETGRYFD